MRLCRGVTVLEVYGSTETCPIAIYQRPDADEIRIGSTGLPALHCQARVVSGYWRNETATRETLRVDWYRSGDIGYRDEAGYYFVVDRKRI